LLDYLNPFSDKFILKTIFDGLANILSYLNPLSENFFGHKLIELLKDALQWLFVPSEERVQALLDVPRSKLAFIDSIKTAINSMKDMINNLGSAPKFTLNLKATPYTDEGNYVILDLSWYAPYKNYGDLVLTGFIYAFFLWRIFITIPSIINGHSGTIIGDYNISDSKYYNSKHGFGKHF